MIIIKKKIIIFDMTSTILPSTYRLASKSTAKAMKSMQDDANQILEDKDKIIIELNQRIDELEEILNNKTMDGKKSQYNLENQVKELEVTLQQTREKANMDMKNLTLRQQQELEDTKQEQQEEIDSLQRELEETIQNQREFAKKRAKTVNQNNLNYEYKEQHKAEETFIDQKIKQAKAKNQQLDLRRQKLESELQQLTSKQETLIQSRSELGSAITSKGVFGQNKREIRQKDQEKQSYGFGKGERTWRNDKLNDNERFGQFNKRERKEERDQYFETDYLQQARQQSKRSSSVGPNQRRVAFSSSPEDEFEHNDFRDGFNDDYGIRKDRNGSKSNISSKTRGNKSREQTKYDRKYGKDSSDGEDDENHSIDADNNFSDNRNYNKNNGKSLNGKRNDNSKPGKNLRSSMNANGRFNANNGDNYHSDNSANDSENENDHESDSDNDGGFESGKRGREGKLRSSFKPAGESRNRRSKSVSIGYRAGDKGNDLNTAKAGDKRGKKKSSGATSSGKGTGDEDRKQKRKEQKQQQKEQEFQAKLADLKRNYEDKVAKLNDQNFREISALEGKLQGLKEDVELIKKSQKNYKPNKQLYNISSSKTTPSSPSRSSFGIGADTTFVEAEIIRLVDENDELRELLAKYDKLAYGAKL